MTSLPIEARRHPLVAEVRKRLVDRCAFHGGRLVVGVSGGADSLALLIALCVIRSQQHQPVPVQPIALHVHHHLRESADADADHVAAVCDRLKVPYHLEHVRIDTRGNIAAMARRARYEALRRVAVAEQVSAVAVAHHAEDQLETLLMALGRGAGPRGLAGMAWTRPLSQQPSAALGEAPIREDGGVALTLIRPLLGASGADCEAFCRTAGIAWCEDPTNRDRTRARVRVRDDVLPILEELWPGSAGRATVVAEFLHEAAAAMEGVLETVFGSPTQREWSRDALRKQRPALLAAGLHRAAAVVPETRENDLEPKLTQLMRAAEAICDDEVKPRTFQLSDAVDVIITSRAVTLRA